MKKSRGNKGQFSIIAAILASIILVAAVVMIYSMIRHNPMLESPKVLSSIEEMNLGIKRILEFTVGYYGSIIKVTGNATYAKDRAASYFESGLVNIARSHPDWNPSFDIDFQRVSTLWFTPESYSMGNISVTYSLSGLGVQGVKYKTSSLLKATILEPTNNSQARVLITREDNEPELRLRTENFFFYSYSYSDSTWKLVNPESNPQAFSNGTYLIQVPSGVDQDCFSLEVVDPRGITVTTFYSEASLTSGIPQFVYTLTWNSTLYSSLTRDTFVVEALQNGTLRWLGQNLQLSTQVKPIPPLPVKALHINWTVGGVSREVPFQVEDWGSSYRVPLGLSSNASVFSSRNMLAFLVNHGVQKVTLWWDGRDAANQTSYAWKNRYFNDNPDADPNYGVLNNGIVSLRVYNFRIESTVVGGTFTSTAEFMRINGEKPTYGAKPAYVIYNGIVRNIIQQEAEWSGGIVNCPNVYSQIVLTLPANATYYTYALRTIFVSSSQSRTITDLSAIQLSSGWMSGLRSLTENGTSGGYPIIGETFAGQNKLFYNFSSPSTGWAHHWSEYISGTTGGGIMFTDSANRKLYTFDSIAGDKTGALSVTTAQRTGWNTPTAVYSVCGQDGNYPASRAIDGDTGTSWRHSTTENHWIILDMGKTTDISKIRIYQSGTSSYRWGQSSGIEVYVSNDPANWGSAVWVGTLDASGWRESGTFSKQGRYVRLYSRSTSSSQRFYEVQVETQERQVTIEFNPVKRYQASFTNPLDVTWHGAVVTFEDGPIYPSSGGNIGLWVMAERPPTVAVS